MTSQRSCRRIVSQRNAGCVTACVTSYSAAVGRDHFVAATGISADVQPLTRTAAVFSFVPKTCHRLPTPWQKFFKKMPSHFARETRSV